MKSRLAIKIVSSAICAAFLSAPVSAEETKGWKEMLASDQVTIKGNKMTIEGYDLCTAGDANLQIKTYSEAPNDGSISRDNFVAFSAMNYYMFISLLGDNLCKHIDTPIANVDIEFTTIMTDSGMKTTSHDHRTNTENSTTVLWSDVL